MSLRTLTVSPPLVSLFLFSALVVAKFNVTANCTLPSFSWTFNSIGQSPCTVAGNMFATCISESTVLPPLPSGYTYVGPTRNSSNTCQCSTVGYSLISACAACQDGSPNNWAQYTADCTHILHPSQFPNPVPEGTYVPHWAILDVTLDNHWDSDESYHHRNRPEYGPGKILNASVVHTSFLSTSSACTSSTTTSSAFTSSTTTSSTTTSSTITSSTITSLTTTSSTTTSSSSASSTTRSTISQSDGLAGAATGISVGGLAITSIAVAAILYLRRRRSQAAPADVGASQPMLIHGNDGAVVQPSPRPPPLTMRLYDPYDSTTFPQSQDIRPVSHVTLSPRVRSGTSADMHALPQAKGYCGLPMPG